MSKQVLTLDSTQITAFLDCPRLWYYSYKQSLQPNWQDEKDALNMGSLGHTYLEMYYRGEANGLSKTQALEHALAFNPDDNCAHCKHASEDHKFDKITNTWFCRACKPTLAVHEYIAKEFPLNEVQRKFVRDQLRLYMYTYSSKDFYIDDPSKAELGFSYLLHEDDRRLFVLEGRIDIFRPSYCGDAFGYVDHKFQMRASNLYPSNIQFKNYALVVGKSMNMVNYIRFHKNVTKDTFHREIISFNLMQREAWKARLISVFHRIADALETAEVTPQYWQTMISNPQWNNCTGKWGYYCPFGSVCEQTSPEMALIQLMSNFKKKEEWRPWMILWFILSFHYITQSVVLFS